MAITKKLTIIANWKSNKTVAEAEDWIENIKSHLSDLSNLINLKIILCPPFTLLYPLSLKIPELKSLRIALAAQDVSPFPSGAYTGEVSSAQLQDLGVKYVLIGHSERRKYFKEDQTMLANKVREALDYHLTPIYCVSGESEIIPDGVMFTLYEPDFAIGSGKAGDPIRINEVAQKFKENYQGLTFLYGGSVNLENVVSFCQQKNIDGVGVGYGLLDPDNFLKIISYAAKI